MIERTPMRSGPITIEGVVHIDTNGEPSELRGIVRLEDITEADAPARVIAEAELIMPAQSVAARFRLIVDRAKISRGRYSLSVELRGPESLWGTVQNYPWDDGRIDEQHAIHVRRWS